MDPMAGLSGLFLSAFLSATLLPGNSEIALGALLVHDPSMHWRAIAVATTGNTLGGMTSYAIGRLVRSPQNNRTIRWLARYGLRCYFSHGSRLLVTRCVLPLAAKRFRGGDLRRAWEVRAYVLVAKGVAFVAS